MMERREKSSWLFFIKIIFPTIVAISLFIATIFAIIVPTFEKNSLDHKRNTIRQLTESAWSTLASYEQAHRNGELTLKQSQQRASDEISHLRYGSELKDYFWINDLEPKMIMHPYRQELQGENLSNYQDRRGKKLFLEFVDVVKKNGEGYVDYTWQWKDDPNKDVPKLSYVKEFKPWGWIIGTGIYIEDVKEEIAKLTNKLIHISLLITGAIFLLLVFITQQSFRIERQRRSAETGLHDSREKYKTLVEAATEGTAMILDGKYAFSNKTMQEMLGYSDKDFSKLSIEEILFDSTDKSDLGSQYFLAFLNDESAPPQFETRLKHKTGTQIEVVLTMSHISFAGKDGCIIIAKDVSKNKHLEEVAEQRHAAQERETLIAELQSSLLFLNEPIAAFAQNTPPCQMDTPINEVAAIMTKQNFSATLIAPENAQAVGIVTDCDLRRRALAQSTDLGSPISSIMSSPLITISESSLIFEAILLMQQHRLQHLVVKDQTGKITGIVRNRDILQLHRYSSTFMFREIQSANSIEQIINIHQRKEQLISSLVKSGAKAKNITHIITATSDLIVEKYINFAIAELGAAPTRFAFAALGSEGREEQTLITDQDNAIIYDDTATDQGDSSIKEYFHLLAKKVCSNLDKTGYTFCNGDVMAQNPKWCISLTEWKKQFSQWINIAAPQDFREFNIFFDFRCVYGDKNLTLQLRNYIYDLLKNNAPFFMHFALDALQYKLPIGMFGKIVVDSSGQGPDTFDIKEAMLPIVNFARLYALHNDIHETNTLERLHKLYEKNVLQKIDYEEIILAYNYLMQTRFKHQTQAISNNLEMNNNINPKDLAHIDETTLKQTFYQIAAIQKRIKLDFTGNA